jgi:glycosyltransferase involved in cell wall biosynthesis
VPVVVYDVDGAKEVCAQDTGRLVEPGDLGALREAVLWMMDHPQERVQMGECGRAACRERFDASRMVEQLEAVYASVLELPATGTRPDAGPGAD